MSLESDSGMILTMEKSKNSEKNLSRCHFVHHKSHAGANPGLRGDRPASNDLSLAPSRYAGNYKKIVAELTWRSTIFKPSPVRRFAKRSSTVLTPVNPQANFKSMHHEEGAEFDKDLINPYRLPRKLMSITCKPPYGELINQLHSIFNINSQRKLQYILWNFYTVCRMRRSIHPHTLKGHESSFSNHMLWFDVQIDNTNCLQVWSFVDPTGIDQNDSFNNMTVAQTVTICAAYNMQHHRLCTAESPHGNKTRLLVSRDFQELLKSPETQANYSIRKYPPYWE
jgi:hypothetical protein